MIKYVIQVWLVYSKEQVCYSFYDLKSRNKYISLLESGVHINYQKIQATFTIRYK